MLSLLLACVTRTVNPEESARAGALAAADARWAARSQGDNLRAAMDGWREILAKHPDDPLALARLSRAEWTLGQLDPAAGAAHFEAGQDLGWRCLQGWPTFAAVLQTDGYRVTSDAAATLPDEALGCVTWVVVNGLTTSELRGPGARLALESLTPLVRRMEATPGALEPGFGPWASARLSTLAAAPDPSPADARAGYAAAVAAAPAVGLFRVQFAAAFPDARDQAFAGFPPPGEDAWALENAVWASR